jgi:antagonist of KipI
LKFEAFSVINPGTFTTFQDGGRQGYLSFGIPESGAMDSFAYTVGNLLVGNKENVAALEITISGCQLRALRDLAIAITGADLGPTIQKKPVKMWRTLQIKEGEVIHFSSIKNGCRAYLTVAGGFRINAVLGSASTYVRAGIGGLEGRTIKKGDILYCNATDSSTCAEIPENYLTVYCHSSEVRVVWGPQKNKFEKAGIVEFLKSDYIVSPNSDRMGYRLLGSKISHKKSADIYSEGIPLGAIQVPGDGQPIILLADRPVTGGYPKIATVIGADLPKVAQLIPGDKIHFRHVSINEALTGLENQNRLIDNIKKAITNYGVN